MKKLILIFSNCLVSNIQAQTWKTEDQYIQRFAQYAVEEMELYKNIPASITLAQGLFRNRRWSKSGLGTRGKITSGLSVKKTGRTKP